MSHVLTRMSLKVLYAVDNEPNSFLTRSKAPLEVRVTTIPSPSNDSTQLKIGIIDLFHVLDQVYGSSPELFPIDSNTSSNDYNVYCRDASEIDEPFVSFGLLSKLRQEMEQKDDSDEEDDDTPFVVGRVCSNFTQLLRRSKSSMLSAPSGSINSIHETLEVKLRFSKVITATSSRRSSIGAASSAAPVPARRFASSTNVQRKTNKTAKQQALPPPMQPALQQQKQQQSVQRRVTNPMPAPKAFRTQSLPIWNNNQVPNTKNFGLPRNSIAHKIYMADRMPKDPNTPASQPMEKKLTQFNVTSLQHDNTIQKFKVDNDVSKRFDFMNKKMPKRPTKTNTKRPNKRSARNSVSSSSNQAMSAATPPVKTPVGNIPLPQNKAQSPSEFDILTEDPMLQEFLTSHQLKSDDIFQFHDDKTACEDDKENVPPPQASTTNFDHLFSMGLQDLKDLKTPNDVEKLQQADEDLTRSDSMEWFNDLFGPSSPQRNNGPGLGTTPKDVNTCNTLPLENDEEDVDRTVISDIDKTSPVDTLSMPLLELEQRPPQQQRPTTCQDQLRRLPLLPKKPKGLNQEDEADDDATSIVMNFSTSPQPSNFHSATAAGEISKRSTPSSPIDLDDDYMDEDTEQRLKKRKTMPSSPTIMFNYRDNDHDDGRENGDDDEEHDGKDEEFSFRNKSNNEGINSTPATQYGSSDIGIKPKDEENCARKDLISSIKK